MGDFLVVKAISTQARQVVYSGQGAQLLENRDPATTVYLGSDEGFTPAGADVGPLDPLGFKAFDGSGDVWARTADGAPAATVVASPGGISTATSPALIAAQILSAGLATAANQTGAGALATAAAIATGSTGGPAGGVPLLHGIVNRLNATSGGTGTIAVPAASFAFPFIGSITKPGYLIYVSAATGAATVPYLQVQLNWKDTVTGLVTGTEHWYIPASSSGSFLTVGKGPVKGGELAINLQNLDPAVAMTVSLAFFETTHHIARDDWRSDQPLNVPGFTPATCDPFGGLIINQVGSLIAHASASFLMPMYAGKLSIYAAMNQVGSIQFNAMSTAGPPGTSYVGNQLGVQPIVAGTPSQFEQDTGRWPIVCAISNGSASAATYSITGTIVEYAS